MQGVHGAQGVRRVQFRQYFLKKLPEVIAARQIASEARAWPAPFGARPPD
jgi:hypothetical protein